jgi:hypothetical protein
MPSYAPFTVSDRETTPVVHNFVPSGETGGVFNFSETAAVKFAENTVSISSRDTGNRNKVSIRLKNPVVYDAAEVGQPEQYTLLRTNYVQLTFDFAAGATTQERDNILGMINGLITDGHLVDTSVADGEPIY